MRLLQQKSGIILTFLGSSGGSASEYSTDGWGFATHTRRPFLGPPCLNVLCYSTGNLRSAEKGTGHPPLSCRRPSIMGTATCPLATTTFQYAISVGELDRLLREFLRKLRPRRDWSTFFRRLNPAKRFQVHYKLFAFFVSYYQSYC